MATPGSEKLTVVSAGSETELLQGLEVWEMGGLREVAGLGNCSLNRAAVVLQVVFKFGLKVGL